MMSIAVNGSVFQITSNGFGFNVVRIRDGLRFTDDIVLSYRCYRCVTGRCDESGLDERACFGCVYIRSLHVLDDITAYRYAERSHLVDAYYAFKDNGIYDAIGERLDADACLNEREQAH